MNPEQYEQEILNRQAGYNLINTPYITQQENNTSALAELTNPQQELEELENNLKGQTIDIEGNTKQISAPLCNNEGTAAIMRLTKAIVSRKSFLSNYDEEDIPKLIIYLGKTLIRDLMLNKKKYDIKDNTARHQIVMISCVTAFSALKRGLENGERRWLKGGIMEAKVTTEGNGKTNTNAWDRIKAGFK